jgi:transcriptional regulator with XRE-family HTH domain
MPYPNRLDELMLRAGINGQRLADLAGTSKQQIHKLRHGNGKLTREWAERFAPHLGVDWPEVIGWERAAPGAPPDGRPRRTEVLTAVGERVQWARTYRGLSLETAATRFCIGAGRIADIEAGREEMTILEAVTIATKLQISTDFLLRGALGTLPYAVGQDFQDTFGERYFAPLGME